MFCSATTIPTLRRWLAPLAALIAIIALLLSGAAGLAQEPPTDDPPMAYAVLYYTPTCPYCHHFIDDDLPKFYEEFGDQLEVLFVDASQAGGSQLFRATCDALDTQNRCGGVPMMAIGETLLFGGYELPEYGPGLIREGLAAGGIGLPPVPALQEAYSAYLAQRENAEAADDADRGVPAQEIAPSVAQTPLDRLAADPVANGAAVLVLFGLVGSLGYVATGLRQAVTDMRKMRLVDLATRVVIGAALLSGVTLVIQPGGDTLAILAAWLVLALLALAAMMVFTSYPRRYAIPLVTLAGLVVAGYMAYVEATATEAMCGALGNCNAVQQSEYAQIFGIPIGVLGIAGYLAILGVWGIDQARGDSLKSTTRPLLAAMVVFGVVFSVYLTFLEPFVIGATCFWCLTSALTMLLLLWLILPESQGQSRRAAGRA
jgi:uncharacterized membrane protein